MASDRYAVACATDREVKVGGYEKKENELLDSDKVEVTAVSGRSGQLVPIRLSFPILLAALIAALGKLQG